MLKRIYTAIHAAATVAGNILAHTIEGDRFENPSPRKIGIAMASASPLAFQLTVGALEESKEMVVFIPAHWTFMVSTDRSIMIISGTSPTNPTHWHKIQYNTATGLAYRDAESINLAA